jgi:hypothetical protein
MKRVSIAFAALILMFCAPASAQIKPEVKAEDPVLAELAVAKQKYRAVVSEAKKRMIAAFDNEDKTVTADKTLKLADKLKLLEQIALDKTAFQVDGTFPKSPGMKEAVDTFEKQLKEAREICESAFDAAAEKRFLTDRKAAKLVLEEKPEFFRAGGLETELKLKKAKLALESALEAAGAKLSLAFDEQQTKLDESKTPRNNVLIEKLKKEKTAFEADPGFLPDSPAMKPALADYSAAVAAEIKKAEVAYDQAAKEYRELKNTVALKALLEDKTVTLGIFTPGKFEVTSDPGGQVRNVVEIFPNGKLIQIQNITIKGTWSQRGRIIVFTYDDKQWGKVILHIKSADALTGENVHTNGTVFKNSLTRIK